MKTRTLYEIREYKTPTSYSRSLGAKLRPRNRAIKIIARLSWGRHRDRDLVMIAHLIAGGAA